MAYTVKCERSLTVCRAYQLLLMIYIGLLTNNDTTIWNNKKEKRVLIGTRIARSISTSKKENYICTDSCAVWPRKRNDNWNQHIGLYYWNENDLTRTWWKGTSGCFLLMKISPSRGELQHSWQGITSHSDSIQNMENLFRRSTTHGTCEDRSQESDLLHNNQRVD